MEYSATKMVTTGNITLYTHLVFFSILINNPCSLIGCLCAMSRTVDSRLGAPGGSAVDRTVS